MARKKKKRRSFSSFNIIFAVVILIIAFSLSARWITGRRVELYSDVPYTIEVLNGSGENGVATRVATELRKLGFDVLIVGNADRFDYTDTVIIDRKGNTELVERLARLTGIRNTIVQKIDTPLVDATVIIGHDIHDLKLGRLIEKRVGR